jgi:ubiquinol-cytochrome c reductase cytochrome c subunit
MDQGSGLLRRSSRLLGVPVLLALAAGLLVALAGPTLAQDEQGGDAEQEYLAACASCHGDEGEGTPRGPVLKGVGAASMQYYLTTGRMPIDDPDALIQRGTPAYSPELIEGLITHVEGFGGGGPPIPELDLPAADVAHGGVLYRSQCASCHTTAGVGGALLYQEAPPVHAATATQTADAIRVGPGTMPAFGEAALSDKELNDVVAYVEYLDSPADEGGLPLGHLGPLVEGLVGWVVGMGTFVLLALWIGKGAKL